MKKLIKRIAYFENDTIMQDGSNIPKTVGETYRFNGIEQAVGIKFALLLRAYGFMIDDCEEVYINFTQDLAENKIQISSRKTGRWHFYINYGLNAQAFNQLPDEEKNTKLVAITENIIRDCFAESEKDEQIIHETAKNIILYGEKLEIVFQAKYDKTIAAFLSFNVLSDGRSRVLIVIKDHNGNIMKKEEIAFCATFEEAMNYAGIILIRKDRIIVKPKNNIAAKNIKPYEVILTEE